MARTDNWNTQELIGKSTYWLGRRFKPIWRLAETEYDKARQRAFELCNEIRTDQGLPPYTWEKFDEGWQYRTIFHERYVYSRSEFVNLVFGWW